MANIIDRNALSGLIPEPVTREIMQGAITESAVLRMGRRLANMSSKTQTINVLDALPSAYFVNGEATDNGAGDAFKQTTKMAWDKKKLYAEEIAVIVPIPEAALDDADYDIWGEVRPRLTEAFGKVIDAAILFGTNKPSTWRNGVVPSAIAAGNGVPMGTDVFSDIMGESGLISKVELDGFNPNGVMSAIQMRGKLRGLKDTTGQPIFKSDMQGATRYGLDGMDMQDRISLYPGRVKLTPVSGQDNVYDMTRQDNPTTEGTPLNKSTLLTDEVAETLGLDPATATPSQAINAVAGKATDKKLSLTLAAASWTGSASPYTQGVTITGGTATSQADIQADATAIQQMLDDGTNAIYIANNNGTFTAYAVGEKPTADLSVQVTVYDVKEVV